MTDRKTASTITDDELEALYAERDRLAEAATQTIRRLVIICGAMPESLNYYVTRIRFAINILRAANADPAQQPPAATREAS